MRRRAIGRVLLLSAAGHAAALPCAAQVDARLDAAVALVKYDGYLSSGAASLSPSMTWHTSAATVAARGTFLLFESGNTSVQGLLSAATFTAPLGPLRLEAAGEVGGSAYSGYSTIARFGHLLGHARLHVMGTRFGLFVGGMGGDVESPGASHGAAGVSAGAWTRWPAGALEVAWTDVTVGDLSFSDLEGRARSRAGVLTLEAVAGVRGPGNGAGSRGYGDVSATLRLTDRLEAVVATGSYPSDPVRGTIPGHYATAGLRLATRGLARRSPAPRVTTPSAEGRSPTPARLAGVQAAVEPLGQQAFLVVTVEGEHRVEVVGDFTDWQPVALEATGGGRYRYAIPLASGVVRYTVRLDGGPWGVPEDAAVELDEFGGSVGLLVVP